MLNRSKHTEEFAGGKGSPRLDYKKKNSKLNKNKRASGGMGERERKQTFDVSEQENKKECRGWTRWMTAAAAASEVGRLAW
jgi:hypothetical protein